MAAVLPAINPAGSKLTHGQGKITRNVGSVSVKENGANVQIKKLRNKDQAEEKIKSLRSQNPFLTKKDTIQYVYNLPLVYELILAIFTNKYYNF